MWHRKRIWGPPQRVDSADDLAEKVTEHTWTLCQAFEHRNYFYLNDATSEDGAQEYAVVKRGERGFSQVESITFSWCRREEALLYINEASAGKYDDSGVPVFPRFDDSPNHRCGHCA